MHLIRNIYIYIWKPALLVVYKYIYIIIYTNMQYMYSVWNVYIYSKHVSNLTSLIFYLYDILSAGGNYFLYIYIKYSICILITFT